MHYINLPGIFNSEPTHWHSFWESEDATFKRFNPADWNNPELEDWKQALERDVQASPQPPILVAHSLSCLLVAHWAQWTETSVAGAFLVAAPDPAGPKFPRQAASFRQAPVTPLPFPAVIVASRNDPYSTYKQSELYAEQWQAGLVDIGEKGHINEDSRLGNWQEGRRLLTAFEAGLRKRIARPYLT